MPSAAVRDAKFGFFVAVGFFIFFVTLSILTGLSLAALGKKR